MRRIAVAFVLGGWGGFVASVGLICLWYEAKVYLSDTSPGLGGSPSMPVSDGTVEAAFCVVLTIGLLLWKGRTALRQAAAGLLVGCLACASLVSSDSFFKVVAGDPYKRLLMADEHFIVSRSYETGDVGFRFYFLLAVLYTAVCGILVLGLWLRTRYAAGPLSRHNAMRLIKIGSVAFVCLALALILMVINSPGTKVGEPIMTFGVVRGVKYYERETPNVYDETEVIYAGFATKGSLLCGNETSRIQAGQVVRLVEQYYSKQNGPNRRTCSKILSLETWADSPGTETRVGKLEDWKAKDRAIDVRFRGEDGKLNQLSVCDDAGVQNRLASIGIAGQRSQLVYAKDMYSKELNCYPMLEGTGKLADQVEPVANASASTQNPEVPTAGNTPVGASVDADRPEDVPSPTEALKETKQTSSQYDLLNVWVDSFKQKDLVRHVNCYSAEVETYFKWHNVTRQTLLTDKGKLFGSISTVRTMEVSDLNLQKISAGESILTFNKKWDIALATGKSFSGEEVEQLGLQLVDGSWHIKSEQEVKILWTKRQ